MNVGDWVRCERESPAKGTWARYDGRVGRIVTINADFTTEYGVRFTAGGNERTAWFMAHELVVCEKPSTAPMIRIRPRRGTQRRTDAQYPGRQATP